jgi:hypothetical protein
MGEGPGVRAMDRRNLLVAGLGLGGLVAVGIPAAMFAVRSAQETFPTEPPDAEDADVFSAGNAAAMPPIDPALVHYEQTAQIASGLGKVHALAVGPRDEIYVGGDRRLCRFAADGKKLAEIALDGEPACAAVGGADHAAPGRIYVGMTDHVEAFDPAGNHIAAWDPPGKNSILTSIAAGEEDVFVADAGGRIVWRYDPAGKRKARIGDPDPKRRIPGFVITSTPPYFDLGMGADGLVYVVNPRALRLEGYTRGGDLETFWGKGSPAIEDFFGCCNPAHFAVLPKGRFVTAEKGFPAIKVYSPQGKFECLVAGPPQMKHTAAGLAADSRGRVLVLDPTSASVRVFERKKEFSEAK